jgi:hypothetical protein
MSRSISHGSSNLAVQGRLSQESSIVSAPEPSVRPILEIA